ncbi:MAG TPA: serine hydrolase domain-containing protein [Vicinamibacterales bacterium]|nr:serine hydrolase domain-containing protein [Vicinamibacterales bacterium]
MPDDADVRSRLDAFASKTPGLQYLVVSPGGTVFEYAGGVADLAARRPMTLETSLMAYSMSKTITAAAVLQLAGAGQIALDAPLDRYVDAQPYGPEITVRQVLSHTSGIPNPIPLRWVHPAAEHASFDEAAALAAVLRQHPRAAFAPGAKYAYSNIGYWLLGSVIARASGEPFVSYVTVRVLRPLGIDPSDLGYAIEDPATHATGYLEKYSLINLIKGAVIDRALVGEYHGSWLEIRPHYPNGPAFGGLVGTARGFGAFLRDQLQPRSRLFDAATRALFYEPQHTAGGRTIAMTLGWHTGSAGASPCFYKEGGGGGFHCMMRVYPASRIASVVMTNATGIDVRGLLDRVDPPFLG